LFLERVSENDAVFGITFGDKVVKKKIIEVFFEPKASGKKGVFFDIVGGQEERARFRIEEGKPSRTNLQIISFREERIKSKKIVVVASVLFRVKFWIHSRLEDEHGIDKVLERNGLSEENIFELGRSKKKGGLVEKELKGGYAFFSEGPNIRREKVSIGDIDFDFGHSKKGRGNIEG